MKVIGDHSKSACKIPRWDEDENQAVEDIVDESVIKILDTPAYDFAFQSLDQAIDQAINELVA